MMNRICVASLRRWRLVLLAIGLSILFGAANSATAQPFGAGTFQGIIRSESYNDEGFGFITLTLTPSGAFSMRFNVGLNNVGQHYYAKSGKFDADGHYHFEGPPVTNTRYEIPRVIDLQLDSLGAPTRITGMLTDYTHSSGIEMDKVSLGSPESAAKAGSYSFVVSGGDASERNGSGHVLIDRRGHLMASGRAPDGRTFSQTANITVYNRWPVFAPMAGTTNGIFSGWVTFQDSGDGAFDGQLTWIGREVPGPNHAFVPLFVTEVSLSGSRK